MQQVYADVNIQQIFSPATSFPKLSDLVYIVVKNAFVFAGVIAFVLLIVAGFGMIAAAGSGDSKKLEQGQKAITSAVLGLIIVVGSVWIIQIIGTLTGLSLPFK